MSEAWKLFNLLADVISLSGTTICGEPLPPPSGSFQA